MDVIRCVSTFLYTKREPFQYQNGSLFEINLYLLRYNRIKQNLNNPAADHSVV